MPQPSINAADRVPRWIVLVGSLAIAFHLFSVAIAALAGESGPWPNMEGAGGLPSPPPQFANYVNEWTMQHYMKHIMMTHNDHFTSNRPGLPAVYIEVKLKDEAGQEIKTLKFPQDDVNYWVHHRQMQLANALGNDIPVENQQGEVIPAPNRPPPSITYWDMAENQKLKLVTKPLHEIPRDRTVWRPSQWSMLLARSYGRYMCRTNNATSVEITRHFKQPMPPAVLFMGNVRAEAFDDVLSTFGEFSR
jgi:hypothetical protein